MPHCRRADDSIRRGWNIDAAASLLAVFIELLDAYNNLGARAEYLIAYEIPTWAYPHGEPLPYDVVEERNPRRDELVARYLGIDNSSDRTLPP